jgi:hypothetical protein
MRDLRELAGCGVDHPGFGPPDPEGRGGCYVIVSPYNGAKLRVIAANDAGWDHVSVSLPHRCPSWQEMEHIKRAFFRKDEWAMQLHAPPSKHINCHPYCLHLWRPHDVSIPVPPESFV